MLCCGTRITHVPNREALLKRLKNLKDLNLHIKLNKLFCELNAETGRWEHNFKTEESRKPKEKEEEIKKLKQTLYEKENELEELEKTYLAKVIRLLYMAQTHCQFKSENEQLFEKYGIKEGNIKLDQNKTLINSIMSKKETIKKEDNEKQSVKGKEETHEKEKEKEDTKKKDKEKVLA